MRVGIKEDILAASHSRAMCMVSAPSPATIVGEGCEYEEYLWVKNKIDSRIGMNLSE